MGTDLALNSVTPQTWAMMREQADVLVKTNFLPAAVKTAEQAIAIMMKGRELGIPAMQALSSIAVIQGKPTAGSELMLALIYRDHGDEAVKFTESTATVCTVAYKRRSWKEPQSHSFTAEDAKRAGLSGQNWQKYPAAMLRARCISAVARMAFPDSIGGMYTPEELGASVQVESDGEITVIEDQRREAPVSNLGNTVLVGKATRNAEVVDDEIIDAAKDPENLFGEQQSAPNHAAEGESSLRHAIDNLVEQIVRISGRDQSGVEGRVAQRARVEDIHTASGDDLQRVYEEAVKSLETVQSMVVT